MGKKTNDLLANPTKAAIELLFLGVRGKLEKGSDLALQNRI